MTVAGAKVADATIKPTSPPPPESSVVQVAGLLFVTAGDDKVIDCAVVFCIAPKINNELAKFGSTPPENVVGVAPEASLSKSETISPLIAPENSPIEVILNSWVLCWTDPPVKVKSEAATSEASAIFACTDTEAKPFAIVSEAEPKAVQPESVFHAAGAWSACGPVLNKTATIKSPTANPVGLVSVPELDVDFDAIATAILC